MSRVVQPASRPGKFVWISLAVLNLVASAHAAPSSTESLSHVLVHGRGYVLSSDGDIEVTLHIIAGRDGLTARDEGAQRIGPWFEALVGTKTYSGVPELFAAQDGSQSARVLVDLGPRGLLDLTFNGYGSQGLLTGSSMAGSWTGPAGDERSWEARVNSARAVRAHVTGSLGNRRIVGVFGPEEPFAFISEMAWASIHET